MIYIISFYSDECKSSSGNYLLDEYCEICEGHLRIGEMGTRSVSMLFELYVVYDEDEFLKITCAMQQYMPHLEIFRKIENIKN